MIDDFLVRAALAGLLLSLAVGPLGCFIVWRRMAFFGDATSHAAMLGVAIALASSVPIVLGVLATALGVGASVAHLGKRGVHADTALGVASHGGLAIGLVALALTGPRGIDIEGLLFGDILAVSWTEIGLIGLGVLAVWALLLPAWGALLAATVSPELARAAGTDPDRAIWRLILALAILVAVALKIVGALLVTAMLILPAAAARPLARTPEEMAVGAVILGALSVIGGIAFSWILDAPTGPSIVTAATALFAVTALVGGLLGRRSAT
ncbi:MAG: metal ABC transporter permease [Pseudomonadota bacterium]